MGDVLHLSGTQKSNETLCPRFSQFLIELPSRGNETNALLKLPAKKGQFETIGCLHTTIRQHWIQGRKKEMVTTYSDANPQDTRICAQSCPNKVYSESNAKTFEQYTEESLAAIGSWRNTTGRRSKHWQDELLVLGRLTGRCLHDSDSSQVFNTRLNRPPRCSPLSRVC
jgi:hypothetical protein